MKKVYITFLAVILLFFIFGCVRETGQSVGRPVVLPQENSPQSFPSNTVKLPAGQTFKGLSGNEEFYCDPLEVRLESVFYDPSNPSQLVGSFQLVDSESQNVVGTATAKVGQDLASLFNNFGGYSVLLDSVFVEGFEIDSSSQVAIARLNITYFSVECIN